LDWLHFGFGTLALGRENLAQAIGAKMAVSFRGYDYYVYPIKNLHCYSKLFSKVVQYHVLSESMKKGLMQQGVSEDVIFKITPAIDSNQFTETNRLKFQNELKILTIARLHWIKGLEYSLEALALLKEKGFVFHYTIVGDGPEKERLLFAAHQLGLTDRVTFTGKLEPKVVRQMLEDSTLYVQYSIQEGFCNAVLEAQAMGKLCIVSDAEGLSENVIDGVTGFVVAKRNPVSLASKIMDVNGLPTIEKAEISKKAKERVKSEFRIEEQIEKFILFYEKKFEKV
jgi:colanic acid/amylovoran biosynthesis glycosyltransferase